MIDIVIPIYNAPEDLRRCFKSLLAHTDHDQFSLTLIDDGSPDPRIAEILLEIAKSAPQVRILSNEKNLGFTATVNRAFRETTGNVLLLNSDTVLTPQWLPAMVRCLASDGKIASVTPFSNNAEIASIPVWLKPNPTPTDDDTALIAQACRDIDGGQYPDLPTGVGFCMLIRRQALAALGEFDEVTFGRGYGEENDWCQRAIKAGWRNVLCVGAYVMHTGGQSFSEAKAALVQRNIVKLNQKHPNYDIDVQKFIARDPIASYRRALASRLAALRGKDLPGVLHVLHGKDGGLERHARDLVATQRGLRHYILLALGESWTIEDHADDEVRTFTIAHLNDELWKDFFEGVCARFLISTVHVHHISACRDGLLLALRETAIPYVVTLHDFYFACPVVHLMRADDTYCGAQTDPVECTKCLKSHHSAPQVSVEKWRADNAALLARAAEIIAPSDFTAQTTQKYFPTIPIRVVAHVLPANSATCSASPKILSAGENGWITLAVVGAIGPLKGARMVELIAKRLCERGLAARLVLIGYLDRQFHAGVREDGHWIIHGAYALGELPDLLRAYAASLVIFPAVGPETFGYTLSEVWEAGIAPLVTDVGTLAQRVRDADGGWVEPVPTSHSIDAWIDRCLHLAGAENMAERRRRANNGARLTQQARAHETSSVYTQSSHFSVDTVLSLQPLRWLSQPTGSADIEANLPAKNSIINKLVIKSINIAIKLRYTRLGRFCERSLPLSLKRRIRGMLLSQK